MVSTRATKNATYRAIDNAMPWKWRAKPETDLKQGQSGGDHGIREKVRLVDRGHSGGYTRPGGVMNNEETNSRRWEAVATADQPGADTGGQSIYRRGFGASVSNLAENRQNAVGTINREGKTDVLELRSSRNGNRYKFVPIEPKTDAQRRIIDQSIKDGVNVYFIDSVNERTKADGTTENISWKGGLHLGNGNILLNGDGESYYHEIFHEIEERNPEAAKNVIDRIAFSANIGSEVVRRYR